MKRTNLIALLIITLSAISPLFSGYINEDGEYVGNPGIINRTGRATGDVVKDTGRAAGNVVEGIGEGIGGLFGGGRRQQERAYKQGRYDQERIEDERDSIGYE